MKLVAFTMKIGETEGEDDRVTSVTMPVHVNPETVRSIRPRKADSDGVVQPGTRIEFPNSAALVVMEDVDAVRTALLA